MKRSLFLIGVLISTLFMWGEEISYDQALDNARDFFQSLPTDGKKKMSAREQQPLKLVYTAPQVVEQTPKPAFYVFNRGDKDGFVLVSADDKTRSILGYSTKGAFDDTHIPANVQFWLNRYAQQITAVAQSGNTLTASTGTSITYTPVESLLGGDEDGILYDQDDPYNKMCPSVHDTMCPTGCAATAAVQIMKYHEYPDRGTGVVSYEWEKGGKTLTTDLSRSTYKWKDMLKCYVKVEEQNGRYYGTPVSSTSAQQTAIAQLMKDMGYASAMNYNTSESGGSGTSDAAIGNALLTNFGYDKGLQYRGVWDLFLTSGATYHFDCEEGMMEAAQSELLAERPFFVAGQDPSGGGGHAFVCDGIKSNGDLHINWGWSGLFNGYYPLTAFEPGTGGIGAGQGKYTSGISFLLGIQPPVVGSEITQTICVGASFGPLVEKRSRTKTDVTIDNLTTILFNLGFYECVLNFGYIVYKDKTIVNKCATTSTMNDPMGEEPVDAGRGYTFSQAVPVKVSMPDLTKGLSIGVYDVSLGVRKSLESKNYDPVFIQDRGIDKHKMVLTKDSVYIFPQAAKYSRTNNPRVLTSTVNGQEATLVWSGSGSFRVCVWTDKEMKMYQTRQAMVKVPVSDDAHWAVFKTDNSSPSLCKALSDIVYAPTTIKGVPLTPVEDVNDDSTTGKVSISDGTITVTVPTACDIDIYDTNGMCLHSVTNVSETTFEPLNKGVYIVRMGNQLQKVLVK